MSIPVGQLLLPLLGGFAFVTWFNRTAYYLSRADRTRLVMYSALAAVPLLFASRLGILMLVHLADALPSIGLNELISLWKQLAPFSHSGLYVGSLILGFTMPFVLNRLDPKSSLDITRAYVNRHGDALERFLLQASELHEEGKSEDAIVMITFEDRKIYVGWIQRLPTNPNEPDSYLQMVPLMSGYRGASTLKVFFTTFYDQAISNYAENSGEELGYEQFIRIFPLRNIRSASFFRPALNSAFATE